MPAKMLVHVSATATAPTSASLQAIQNAVAKALRSEGLAVATSDVQVEGRLA